MGWEGGWDLMELDELNGKDFWERQKQPKKNLRVERRELAKRKLEGPKHYRRLSLDPESNQHHHPHHLHYLTHQSLSSRYVEEEEQNIEEEEEDNPDQSTPKSQTPEPQQQPFHTQQFPYFSNSQQHQLHQDLQLQQQQFYTRLAQQQHEQLQPQHALLPATKRSYFSSPPSSTFAEQILQHAQQPNMGERSSIRQTTSRLGMRNSGGGEIIEVQGGHIVRSTGRKDRHSKVCTAKGPRDRRVRLSAHTAIQFYDVQDRLGYDRPSKAVDWLIKKAKAAIDDLAELPPWHPTATTVQTATSTATNANSQQEQMVHGHIANSMEGDNGYPMQHQQQERLRDENNSSFLPPSMDSDSIADTIKTFFPMGASAEPTSGSGMQYYPTDLLSGTRSSSQNNQDLRLSLQSFQDSQFLQSDHHHQQHPGQTHQAIFSGNQLGFDTSTGGESWSDHQSAEMNRFQRLMAWNNADVDASSGGGGFMFNSLPPPPLSQPSLQQLFGHSGQYFTQRGPLQSSNTSSVRAWIDQPIANHHQTLSDHPSTLSGIGNFETSSAFSGFRIPARIRGDNEELDGNHNKSSSAYSDSRH